MTWQLLANALPPEGAECEWIVLLQGRIDQGIARWRNSPVASGFWGDTGFIHSDPQITMWRLVPAAPSDEDLREAYDNVCWGEMDVDNFIKAYRSVLAEPVVAPSDEELEDFALQYGGGYYNCDCKEEVDILTREHVSNYRAVIARWGSTPTPVPVAERPWEWDGWCDADGRCWWGRASTEYMNHDWVMATRADIEEFCDDCPPDVVLPAHALPLPAVPGEGAS